MKKIKETTTEKYLIEIAKALREQTEASIKLQEKHLVMAEKMYQLQEKNFNFFSQRPQK